MSALRCSVGDIAIVRHSLAGNEGKVVTCVRFVGREAFTRCGTRLSAGDDYWVTDTEAPTNEGRSTNCFRDAWLTPLRGDLTDESESITKSIPAEVA